MNKQRLKTTVALVVLVAGLAVLAVLLLGRGLSPYMGVDELAARKAELVGTGIRLAGFLVHRPQVGTDGVTRFHVEARSACYSAKYSATKHESLPVAYRGPLPANLEPGKEILLDGRLEADGVFRAERLLTQCPSRYRKRISEPARGVR